jgi:hypothetical protein
MPVKLTDVHYNIIKEFVETGLQGASFAKFMGKGKADCDRANASNFFKQAEVKRMVKILREAKERAMVTATEKAYQKLYAEEIASTTEIDMFHTKVLRKQVQVQEIFAVREKTLVNVQRGGKMVPVVEERVVFKKVDRQPNIREQQKAGEELYKRSGAYKPLRVIAPPRDEQDDMEAAAKANSGVQSIERVIILSDGSKLKMPE